MRRLLIILGLTVSCWTISGCTIGPTVKTEFVFVTAGHPILVLNNAEVRGQRLDGKGLATIRIGGWIAMPREHFDALKRAAESKPE